MLHIFIINPISGSGDNQHIENYIREIFRESESFKVIYTQYPGHATEIAKEYSSQAECIYAIGGDGTVHEVLNGIDLKVPLAFIPVGSGNDYFVMIDDKKEREIDILKKTIDGKIVEVDFAMANQERYLNCSNMGIDANINYRANQKALHSKFWMKFKKLNYLYCALLELFRLKTFRAKIQVDDKIFEKDVLLCNVSLGKQYGGGFKPTPKASLQDGFLDICIVEYPRPVLRLIYLFPLFYQGKHERFREVTLLTGKNVTVHAQHEVRFGLDGEISDCTEVDFRIVNKGLKLRVPQTSKLV